ncbi:hypothetical protein ACWEPN_33820 [Nonomuraea wenchangensis]
MPELEAADGADGQQPGPRPGLDVAELRQALIELDPGKEWGGLRERQVPESGQIVYLCHRHRQALRYPAQPADS